MKFGEGDWLADYMDDTGWINVEDLKDAETDENGWIHLEVKRNDCPQDIYLHQCDKKYHIISKLVDGEWKVIQKTPLENLTF